MKRTISYLTSALIGLSCLAPNVALGRDVVLAWDPVTELEDGNPPPSAVLYKVHMGTSSRNYTDVQNATLVQLINGAVVHSRVLNFPDDVDVYMAVSSYYIKADMTPSRDSGVSNEVIQAGKIRLQPPAPPELISDASGITDKMLLASATYEYELYQTPDQRITINKAGKAVVSDTIIQFMINKHPEILSGELELKIEIDGVVYDAA